MLNKLRKNWISITLAIMVGFVGHLVLHTDKYDFLQDDNYYAVVAKASYEVKHNIVSTSDSTIKNSDTCRYLIYHYEGVTIKSNSVDKGTFDKTVIGDVLIVRTSNYITYMLCMLLVALVLILALVLNYRMSH